MTVFFIILKDIPRIFVGLNQGKMDTFVGLNQERIGMVPKFDMARMNSFNPGTAQCSARSGRNASGRNAYYIDIRNESLFREWIENPLSAGFLRLQSEREYCSENINFLIAVNLFRSMFAK